MCFTGKLEEEFRWWKTHILSASAPINEPVYDLEIFSHASRTGWGVFCKGRRCHGYWKVGDLCLHINVLELMVVFFGLRCFVKDMQRCNILLRVDNSAAISYINRMRDSGFRGLSSLPNEICSGANRETFGSRLHIFFLAKTSRLIVSPKDYSLKRNSSCPIARSEGLCRSWVFCRVIYLLQGQLRNVNVLYRSNAIPNAFLFTPSIWNGGKGIFMHFPPS